MVIPSEDIDIETYNSFLSNYRTSLNPILKTAKQARDITAHFQTRLIINAHIKVAKDLKVDGVHIDTTAECPTSIRKELYPWQLIGATANSLQDCENFIKKEVDYIYLAPFRSVENTQSTVLGLNGFTVILEALQSDTPIIGVGGINTDFRVSTSSCVLSSAPSSNSFV